MKTLLCSQAQPLHLTTSRVIAKSCMGRFACSRKDPFIL